MGYGTYNIYNYYISHFLCFSPAINGKTTANKAFGLKTFPNFLMLQMRKFTLTENWQPKKLDVLIEAPDTLDITFLRSKGTRYVACVI